MTFKRLIYLFMCLLITVGSFAQDKIFKKNGDVLDVKVTAVEHDVVYYKKSDNLNGPEYTMSRSDIDKVKYANGSEEQFGGNTNGTGSMKTGDMKMSGRHRDIYSLAPIQLTENGFGFGLTWEHIIDKAGWVSFNLPLITTFNQTNNSITGEPKMDPMVYIMPGIKVYTNLNNSQVIKYSINPSLVLGMGRSTAYSYDNPGPQIQSSVYSIYKTRFLLGAMISGGANIFPTPHLYIGGDFGLGFTYLNQYNGVNKGVVALTQLAFKIGYRL